MKTNYCLFLFALLFAGFTASAQVKIGDNPTNLNSNSILELETTARGFVPPRVSLTNISSATPLATTALNGTVVFNINATMTGGSGTGLYYWDSSNVKWIAVTPTSSLPAGPAGGDLSGTYPNPTVAKINGVTLGTTTATSGNLLIGSGTQWETRSVSGDASISNTGALTLASVNSNLGTFNTLTVNAKGLVTAASNTTYLTGSGTVNYVPHWTGVSTLSSTGLLYDNGSGVGINTTTPQNKIDVNGSAAIGTYAGTNAAPSNGLIISGTTGIGTNSPNASTKLDVNGSFKLGNLGTVIKNVASFSSTVSSTSVPTGFTAVTILGISVVSFGANTSYADVTITTPVTFSGTQATVSVSPAFDLPNGVSIASARLSSTSQVKIRFLNASTSSQTVSGTIYITVTEF